MSLSAKERVLKYRKAEYQVHKSNEQKKRVQQFRSGLFQTPSLGAVRGDGSDTRKWSPVFVPNPPLEKDPRDHLFSDLSVDERMIALKDLPPTELPSFCYLPKTKPVSYPSSPYAQPVIPPNLRHIGLMSNKPKPKIQNTNKSAEKAALEALRVLENPPLQQPQLIKTKNSVVKIPKKKTGVKKPNQFQWHENPQPSPFLSQAQLKNLNMFTSPYLSTRMSYQGFPTGSKSKASSGGQKETGSRPTSPLKMASPTHEKHANLCLPSPLKGQRDLTNWVHKIFNSVSTSTIQNFDETRNKSMENDEKRYRHPKGPMSHRNKNISPPPQKVIKEQPLPHNRGLIGIEISEFDNNHAVFYKGRKGTYNPHLNGLAFDKNNNYTTDNEDDDTGPKTAIPNRKKKEKENNI